MTNLLFATLVQTSILMTGVTGGDSYTAAHKVTSETGRPMIVLVGADWCPACVDMKEHVMPKVRRQGLLKKVAFAVVNLDRQNKLGRELTGGGPIPQVIMFRKTADGWRRRKLIGGQSEQTVAAFIEEGVRMSEKDKEAKSDKQTQPAPKPKRAG